MISSNSEVSSYNLLLGGHALTVHSDRNEEVMAKVVALANGRIQDSMAKGYSYQKSLMIALLQLSEEVLILRDSVTGKLKDFESKTQNLISDLEVLLAEEED